MTEWYIALPVTVLIIAASAFFVVIEFSLLSARRHRLEEEAETSGAARAGLRSLNELTVMLAGAQLGITAATFALGAVTKPWVHGLLTPLFEAASLSAGAADVIAFIVSLFIVTFLHLVVGEMAPKSWAIAHPESALRIIAVPARWFVAVFRPLLLWINKIANKLVARTGEMPVDRAAAKGYDTETLHHLVRHSAETGTLDKDSAENLEGVIAIESGDIGQAVTDYGSTISTLPSTATVADVQAKARAENYLRVLIDKPGSALPHVVHAQDTVLADPDEPAARYSYPALQCDAATAIRDVLDLMREHNDQLALVTEGRTILGLITWDDIMNQLWPEIEQKLDRAGR